MVLGKGAGDLDDAVKAADLKPVAEKHEDDQADGGRTEEPHVEGLGLLDQLEFAVLLRDQGLVEVSDAVGEGAVFLGEVFPFLGGVGIGTFDGVELFLKLIDFGLGGERGQHGGLVGFDEGRGSGPEDGVGFGQGD